MNNMQGTEKAIRRSIEGGWKPFGSILYRNLVEQKWGVGEVMANYYHQPTYLLDPEFWKCLSKVEKWDVDTECFYCQQDECDDLREWFSFKNCPSCGSSLAPITKRTRVWLEKQHNMLDHIAEGGSPDEYFNSILK